MPIKIEKTNWDLTPLLSSDIDLKSKEKLQEIESLVNNFTLKWSENSDYLINPVTLKEALDEYEILMNKIGDGGGDVEYYFWLRSQQDQIDSEIKAKYKKIEIQSIDLSNKLIFFTNKLSKIPIQNQKVFLSSQNLKEYNHYLERLFKKGKHRLGDNEEKIISLKSSVSYTNWINMTSSSLSKEEREVFTGKVYEKKNLSEIISLINEKDKKVRDSAALALNDILKKYEDMAQAEINSILEEKQINDKIRNFARSDSSRHLSDDIETEIVDTLISAITEKFDIAKEYYKFKTKLLGLKKLEYHERNVEYGNITKNYDYQESIKIIETTFSKLDKEFLEILKNMIFNGQIDFFPKKGKRQGAFCVWWSPSKPVYIMLNHTNKLNDVLTIAHELGHAINAQLSKKQNALNFNTPTSTTEVASTFMEDFVLQELLKTADDELKLTIYMQKLNDYVTTIIRQIACYNFEKDLHTEFREKGYLPKETIGKLFNKNMSSYMGDYVIQSPGSQNWWIFWNHIRKYYYVYSYASGLLISKSLQSKVKENPLFMNKVKEFLSAGSSKSPKEIFFHLGIDITKKEFWLEGLNEIENLLKETEKLAKKLGKV